MYRIPRTYHGIGRSLLAVLSAGAIMVTLFAGCATTPSRSRMTAASPKQSDARNDSSGTRNAARMTSAHGDASLGTLSPASELLIKACDNYLSLNPESPKTADVLTIKAS
ncbi:MAG: hypothetical protein JXA71_00345, partial [Chitinispirillaceae bacterium]|nr:hypothetical protein [Chitinispirillaceae bacterium]